MPLHAHTGEPLLKITSLPQSVEEPISDVLARDWHAELTAMVRERLPKVLVVLVLLFVAYRVVLFFVNRMQRLAAKRSTGLQPSQTMRAAQLRTMATIIRATSVAVFGFLAFLQLLTLLNVNYAPLLASAGILGVGIGLGAQSLFKDIINGVFILVEDQYNVGEVVKLAGLQGTVEDLTLRTTRLRDGDGTLYVIPNSQIATVSNLSRDYAVASLPVVVDASANPDRVIAVLSEVAAAVGNEGAWAPVLIEKPTVLGVDRIDGRSIVYPVNLRVRPTQKDPILRELRRQIVLRFEREGIPLGSDSSLLIMQGAKADPTQPPAQQPLTQP